MILRTVVCRFVCMTSILLVFLFVASAVQAGVKIRPIFIGGEPPSCEDPPTDCDLAGEGDLQEIFQVAAKAWEKALKKRGGNWHVRIEFGWSDMSASGLYAQETLVSQGGHNPVRITRSKIMFNNKPPAPGFYADPTPRESTEYKMYSSSDNASSFVDSEVDIPRINTARIFSEATGDATGKIDLLTIATHEIGHALGLDYEYEGWVSACGGGNICELEITAPRPYAGLFVRLDFGPHIGSGGEEGPPPLMTPTPHAGWRQLISGLDVLVIAEISLFNRPNLSAYKLPPPW